MCRFVRREGPVASALPADDCAAALAADEAQRWLGRKRLSKVQLACESLYEKIFERKVI